MLPAAIGRSLGSDCSRDGWAIDEILKRFATIRRKASTSAPAWVADAIWIEAALQSQENVDQPRQANGFEPCAFEHLFAPVVKQATELLWSGIDPRILDNLTESAHACLRHSLLKELSNLCAPAIYEQFVKARKAGEAAPDAPTLQRGTANHSTTNSSPK